MVELEQLVAQLQRRVAHREARLNTNSSNSSTPPSVDPLEAPKNLKPKSARQRGGQPGHPPHLQQLLAPERVTRIVPLVPDTGQGCHAPLPAEPGPHDTESNRFQTIELPPLALEVVEYQAHTRTCSGCGQVNQATIPAEIRAPSVGPQLTGTLAYLTGNWGLSKRNVETLAADLLGAPITLGTVSHLEPEVAAALELPHRQALAAVREAEIAFAAETSWKRRGQWCWLWAAATLCVIHAKRSVLGFVALLGTAFPGVLHSDRYPVYRQIPAERRQICWAHLKRDFRKVIDSRSPRVQVGRRGRRIVKGIFAAWPAFREGRVTRVQLREQIEPLAARLNQVLVEGAFGEDGRVAKFCANVLDLEPAWWTFVTKQGVEPTNHFMERLLRQAVLWRKRSFGCNSEGGCRFAERIPTVVQTCRLRERSVLEYLQEAVRAYREGEAAPSLLTCW